MEDVLRTVLNVLEQQASPLFALPVALEEAGVPSIRSTSDDRFFLRLEFPDSSPRDVLAVVGSVAEDEGLLADPPTNQILMRTWLPNWFYLHAFLNNHAPDAILYRGVTGTPSATDVTLAGELIGQATTQLEVAFLAEETDGSWRFLQPAIVGRALASFDIPWQELVVEAIAARPQGSESFGLDRAVAYYDSLTPGSRQQLLFLDAITAEYHARLGRPIDTPPAIDGIYRILVPPPSGGKVARAEFLQDFARAADESADRMAHFHVTDMDLHVVVLRADHFEMDLIRTYDFGEGFLDLEPLLGEFQVIVNGPTFDMVICGNEIPENRVAKLAVRASLYARAQVAESLGIFAPALTKGRLLFRSAPLLVPGDCPITDPQKFRFHFGQTTNGGFSLRPNLIPDGHDFECAFDNVTGVYLDGKRIGQTHEIETHRVEPDEPYGNPEKHPIIDGLPILGTCARSGKTYFFIVMRPDYPKLTPERPEMSTWEEMLALLRDMDVVDAFITDGDDSQGLMIEGEGLVLKPGGKKNGQIVLAVGFRRI